MLTFSNVSTVNYSHTVTNLRVQTNHKYYIYIRFTYQTSYFPGLEQTMPMFSGSQNHFPWLAAEPCKLQPCRVANERIKPLNNRTQLESLLIVKKQDERVADEADYAGIG